MPWITSSAIKEAAPFICQRLLIPGLDISLLYELRFPGNGNSGGTGDKDIRDFLPGISGDIHVPAGRSRPYGEAGRRLFFRDLVFAPLKMASTVASERGKNNVPNRAYGHTKEGDRWSETDQSPTSATSFPPG
jgi:hypothetical protein